jgi:Glycosyl hydrolase family 26
MRKARAVQFVPASILALALGIVLASCGGSPSPSSAPGSSSTSSSTSVGPPSTAQTTTTSPPPVALSPPPVPTGSVYVGAWVNPNHTPGAGIEVSGSQEVTQLPTFTSSVGGNTPRILHVYTRFKAPVPMSTVDAIAADGAVPLIDWGCTDLQAIVSGQEDGVIQQYAQTLKSYAKPVFLRWYWEPNQDNASGRACGGYGDPSAYVAAWQHIWTIFHSTGATNVAFVWCPGLSGGNYAAYYPGDQYVDWIGVDGYDVSFKGVGAGDFNGIFGGFYSEWVGHGKPMMVAETGANGAQQAAFIQSIQSQAPSLPQFKAIVYFDSAGPRADWALQGGTSAFEALLTDPYFSFKA